MSYVFYVFFPGRCHYVFLQSVSWPVPPCRPPRQDLPVLCPPSFPPANFQRFFLVKDFFLFSLRQVWVDQSEFFQRIFFPSSCCYPMAFERSRLTQGVMPERPDVLPDGGRCPSTFYHLFFCPPFRFSLLIFPAATVGHLIGKVLTALLFPYPAPLASRIPPPPILVLTPFFSLSEFYARPSSSGILKSTLSSSGPPVLPPSLRSCPRVVCIPETLMSRSSLSFPLVFFVFPCSMHK